MTTTPHHPVPVPPLFPTWGDGLDHGRAVLRAAETDLAAVLHALQQASEYLDRAPGPQVLDPEDLPTDCGVDAADIRPAAELVRAIGEVLDDLTA